MSIRHAGAGPPDDVRQMVTTECSQDASRVHVVIAPNQSLTWHGALIFFAAAALLSLAIALTFSVMGYWPILPFAGLELLALGAALYVAVNSGRRRQVITITAETVRIEKGRLRGTGRTGGGPESREEFARVWTRVELIRPRQGWYPTRLTIGASGSAVPVGEFLTDEERQALKDRLDDMLARTSAASPDTPRTEFE